MPYFCHPRRLFCVSISLWCSTITSLGASSPDFPKTTQWPTLDSTNLKEIGLVVRENIFDRTHFVIESSCRVTPFERPLNFLDSQVTARWTQSILLQIEPAKHTDFVVDLGLGYSLERSTHSSRFGEILAHSIDPSILFPVTIAYNRPNFHGSVQSYIQLEWELNPYIFSRTTTLFHRLISNSTPYSESSFTLYGRKKISSLSPLDNDFEYKFHQIGFVLERTTY